MCLTANQARTESLQKKKGELTVYKVYKREDALLRAPYMSNSTVKRAGEIKSGRRDASVTWEESLYIYNSSNKTAAGADIEKGIHVYLKESDAKEHQRSYGDPYITVPLKASYADLVGAEAPSDGSHAVFTKVTLSEETWAKIFPSTPEEEAVKKAAPKAKKRKKAKAKAKARTKAKKAK